MKCKITVTITLFIQFSEVILLFKMMLFVMKTHFLNGDGNALNLHGPFY